MRAAVMHSPGSPLVIEERPRPSPSSGLVVDVIACGVCHTDLDLIDSEATRTPHVLGHEVVVAGPSGEPCLVYASWGCRRCSHCRSGDEAMCPDVVIVGVHADGGYAEALVVPDESYLYPIGDLDPAEAAPLADAGATSYRAVRRAMPASRAVVIGVGGLGQFAIQWLRLAGGLLGHGGGYGSGEARPSPRTRRGRGLPAHGRDRTRAGRAGLRRYCGVVAVGQVAGPAAGKDRDRGRRRRRRLRWAWRRSPTRRG